MENERMVTKRKIRAIQEVCCYFYYRGKKNILEGNEEE